MTDASGTTTYYYTQGNLPYQTSSAIGEVSYGYDKAGNMTSLYGGTTVNYTYDALNRLSTVAESHTGTTTYTYDAAGNLQSVTYPNGVVHTYSYDQKNRLTNLAVNASSGPIESYAYTLDNAGHRTAVTELSGRTVNYGYDNIYRLTSEAVFADPSGNNGTINYTYDAVGNRTQQTSTNPAITSGGFGYDADDRLTTDSYDANGNTIGSGGLAYSYDFENHLIQQGGATFVYDGDGNRVEKIAGGVTTKYLVADVNPTGYPQVVNESFSGGTGARELSHAYVYGLDRISQYRSYYTGSTSLTQTSYYVYDGHGSVRALTDPSGNITDTYDYDAFGNLTHSTTTLASPTPNEFLFAGEQYDSNLSLYYNRARYLNVTTGRFWTMDTDEGIAYAPTSLHKYLYAGADPADNSDPGGNQFEDVAFGAEQETSIGAEEDAEALRIYQTTFRTTLYAGNGVLYETPTLLLRAAAALTALAVAASSVISAFDQTPGDLPDVSTSQNNQNPIVLFRDTSGTSPSDFKWRGPDIEPDGLSFFEQAFSNPQPKPFSVGFKAIYVGKHAQGALGGFSEPELYGIGVVYTPQLGGDGHWSCPITSETAQSYADRFAAAAKRIKKEGPPNFLSNPNQ